MRPRSMQEAATGRGWAGWQLRPRSDASLLVIASALLKGRCIEFSVSWCDPFGAQHRAAALCGFESFLQGLGKFAPLRTSDPHQWTELHLCFPVTFLLFSCTTRSVPPTAQPTAHSALLHTTQ